MQEEQQNTRTRARTSSNRATDLPQFEWTIGEEVLRSTVPSSRAVRPRQNAISGNLPPMSTRASDFDAISPDDVLTQHTLLEYDYQTITGNSRRQEAAVDFYNQVFNDDAATQQRRPRQTRTIQSVANAARATQVPLNFISNAYLDAALNATRLNFPIVPNPPGNPFSPRSEGQQRTARNVAESPINATRPVVDNSLRSKSVFRLNCKYCKACVCDRAMKAILLADTKVELFSTDIPPGTSMCLLPEDRTTHGCLCKIRDSACRTCGNVLGYHVSQPCSSCLSGKNNGHFWMYYSEGVTHTERKVLRYRIDGNPVIPDNENALIETTLSWSELTPMLEETHQVILHIVR